jgi:ribosomal protein S13
LYKFRDTPLQFNRRVRDSVSAVYGLGFERASYVCDLLGLGASLNINSLNRYFYELMANIMKYNYFLDDRLKNFLMQRIVFFIENRRVAGVRLGKGLPNRGQRTHTNRKTALRLKPNLMRRIDLFPQTESHNKSKNAKNKQAQNKNSTTKKKPSKK